MLHCNIKNSNEENLVSITGFPIKDARFSKLKNIPDPLNVIRKIKLQKISTKNILAIGHLFWETLYLKK